MKHQYALIREEDAQTFANTVNNAMIEGWVPIGGVAMCREPGKPGQAATVIYAQAMIRRGINGVEIVH